MRPRARSIRGILLGAMVLSAALALALMGAFFTLFSYDLEDAIFDQLVAKEAARRVDAMARDGVAAGLASVPGMTAYVGHASLPPWVAEALPVDTPRSEREVFTHGHGHFHVAVRPGAVNGQDLYVVFDVTELTSATRHLRRTAGLLVTSALLALLAAALLSHFVARGISQPLERLAERVRTEGVPPPGDNGGVAEVRALVDALRARDADLKALLERERAFNRDASHELRTPLSVAQGAVEILELEPPRDVETFERLRHAVHHMGLLTEGILWLARTGGFDEDCGLVGISREMVALYSGSWRRDGVRVVIEAEGEVRAPLPGPVARVMLGNLIKNALAYTSEGDIVIRVEPRSWTITDTGVGFGRVESGQMGFGIGLSLVERLARRFDWEVSITSLEPHGTRVRLTWPPPRPGSGESIAEERGPGEDSRS